MTRLSHDAEAVPISERKEAGSPSYVLPVPTPSNGEAHMPSVVPDHRDSKQPSLEPPRDAKQPSNSRTDPEAPTQPMIQKEAPAQRGEIYLWVRRCILVRKTTDGREHYLCCPTTACWTVCLFAIAGIVILACVIINALDKVIDDLDDADDDIDTSTAQLYAAEETIESLKGGQKRLPNFLVVFTDDLGWGDIPSHGSSAIQMPNLDQFLREGLEFTNFHAGVLCTPGRSAFLTGRHAWNVGLQCPKEINEYHAAGLQNTPTTADLLKPLGYHSYHYGKWGIGWSNWDMWPLSKGFDRFRGFQTSGSSYLDHESAWNLYDFFIQDEANGAVVDFGAIGTWVDDIFVNETLQVIHDFADSDEPFMINLALENPHGSNDEYQDVETSANGQCDHYINWEDQGRYIYCRKLVNMDRYLGRVIDELKATDQWDSTFVFFTSDNGASMWDFELPSYAWPCKGWGSNWPFRGGKGTHFEGGLRVPAVLGGGALEPSLRGTTDARLAHLVDWGATMNHLAGGDMSSMGGAHAVTMKAFGQSLLADPVDDRTIIHTIRATEGCSAWDPYGSLFVEDGVNATMNAVTYQSRWKYMQGLELAYGWYSVDLDRSIDPVEHGIYALEPCKYQACLFDLLNDPYEMTDVAASHPEIVEEIEALLAYAKTSDAYHPGQNFDPLKLEWFERGPRPHLWPLEGLITEKPYRNQSYCENDSDCGTKGR